jgi:SAM-dependent methyltransferase
MAEATRTAQQLGTNKTSDDTFLNSEKPLEPTEQSKSSQVPQEDTKPKETDEIAERKRDNGCESSNAEPRGSRKTEVLLIVRNLAPRSRARQWRNKLRNELPYRPWSLQKPWPQNPTRRFLGYEWIDRTHWSIPLRIAKRYFPSLGRIRSDVPYWRDDYESLNEPTLELWHDALDFKESELSRHFHQIRDDAWQIAQEFCIARWWFLRSVLTKNPYYPEILQLAKDGATVVDLGCGFGQELRWLRAGGATGNMYAIDVKEEMWNLGLQLFQDDSPDWATFRKLNIIDDHSNRDPLNEFADKADVFLLNDVLSFFGPILIENVLHSIAQASRVGTKIIGWAVGQEGDEQMGQRVFGNGSRGTIHNLTSFQEPWKLIQNLTKSKWDVQAKLVPFEQLGFDKTDCEWFASSWFNDTYDGSPMPLKGLCFSSTRIA